MTTTETLPDVAEILARPQLYIDGEWTDANGEAIDAIDPYTEQQLGEPRGADIGQVEAAVTAARRTFDDWIWSGLDPKTRSEILHGICDAMVDLREHFAQLMVVEGGMAISLARMMQQITEDHFRWYCDAAARGPRGGWEYTMPMQTGLVPAMTIMMQEPIGVVAGITPYNIPIMGAVWKIGGALAAGCSTVLLPSPRAQLTSQLFAKLLADADLPPGVFNFIGGEAAVGQALTEHVGVDMITFTGSEHVGSSVMAQGAKTIKRVVLELGGKSPNIVLPGADIASAVPPSVMRFCRNSGQGCGATTRTFVHESQHDDYVAHTKELFAAMPVGNPWNDDTVISPLIRAEHRDRVEGFVDRAIAAGGTIEAGGGRPDEPHGFFMNPALVGGLDNSSEIAQEELFGPVGVIMPYTDIDEMVRHANDSRYGLNANVWGPTPEAIDVARRIRSGGVTVNGGSPQRADVAFGGYKSSGLGREMGEEGFLEFFEIKSIQFPLK